MHAGPRHLGMGEQVDKGGEPGCGRWPAAATCRPWRRWRRSKAAAARNLPLELKVRVVNVVDPDDAAAGRASTRTGFPTRTSTFEPTKDKLIILAFHGYPWLIHRLTYRRTNHNNLHVRGYKEEGTTTTPFDMVVLNDLDRFHLAEDVIDRLPQLGSRAAYFKQAIHEKLIEHKQYIDQHGDDMPAISGWRWGVKGATSKGSTTTEGDNV